ncbi:SDR family NAD(P)-dependent oxidoreductase [Siphonobacter aquaeclarae]|jgi:3-hydroxy acid dehydrogenase/malonic semialdehyde reductase|uniref:NADP-dependent 3-hydroxy acid dehydrogenase YdfG n=1 Tax=Siphonobacter aquaeclarae TaxID=563176 RepID=A0A1G9RDA7_9BACT|nr:SDR family NAD(P)-dependent oxidoreductase [Siphonobacter aquaeclarae]SDM21151.1 NADP-dependent 3-hydroxy acid dehydrogenase YdfG [Siphonobacter aquaeclarae]
MQRTALITGATSGIGQATAKAFADLGYRLILHGRRQERLDELKESLPVEVYTMNFDVRYREDVEEAFSRLPAEWQDIDILLNNAGNAHGLGPVQDNDPDDWDAMIDGNVKGILYVSKAVMPGMIARRSGHILNLSSVAGKQTYPNGTVYCASKAAVESISEGMRLDLNPYGIKVTNIAPGAVETEFSLVRFKGDDKRAASVYQGFTPLSAQDIAETIAFIVTRPAHMVIADILLFPTAQASAMLLKRE